MGNRGRKEFTATTIRQALARQKSYCASCGTRILASGTRAATLHKYGERAEAHHVIPVSVGGTARVDNCVILCRTCHYSVHQGGRWADNSIYVDIKRSSGRKVRYVSITTVAKEYPFYKVTKTKQAELDLINRQ
jgi:hypothetical protein